MLYQVGESKFVFESKTILRMELLVMSTLKWRMQAVTPFSFIDHFLQKINDDKPPPKSSLLRSVELVLGTIRGMLFFFSSLLCVSTKIKVFFFFSVCVCI